MPSNHPLCAPTAVIIGTLATTNVITCIFAYWARQSASKLTDRAFTLAMGLKKEENTSYQGADGHVHGFQLSRDSMQTVPCSMNTDSRGITQSHPERQRSTAIPIAGDGLRRTHHGHSAHTVSAGPSPMKPQTMPSVPLHLCSPIPSNYSKSYSYAPPLMAKRGAYALSNPIDQRMMSPFLGHGMASRPKYSCFAHRDEMEEEKQPVPFAMSFPMSRENSDSSLMYGVQHHSGHTPGTTKGKSKNNNHGEGISPSQSGT